MDLQTEVQILRTNNYDALECEFLCAEHRNQRLWDVFEDIQYKMDNLQWKHADNNPDRRPWTGAALTLEERYKGNMETLYAGILERREKADLLWLAIKEKYESNPHLRLNFDRHTYLPEEELQEIYNGTVKTMQTPRRNPSTNRKKKTYVVKTEPVAPKLADYPTRKAWLMALRAAIQLPRENQ